MPVHLALEHVPPLHDLFTYRQSSLADSQVATASGSTPDTPHDIERPRYMPADRMSRATASESNSAGRARSFLYPVGEDRGVTGKSSRDDDGGFGAACRDAHAYE